MHINVKNIILWQLIAQYFNLIISENRKNVVKSFPLLFESSSPLDSPQAQVHVLRLLCWFGACLRREIVLDKGGNRVMAVTPMKLLLFIRIAFPTSSAKRRTFWTTRNVLVYVAYSQMTRCRGAEWYRVGWHTYNSQLDNFSSMGVEDWNNYLSDK